MKFSIFFQFVHLAYWCTEQIYSVLKSLVCRTKDSNLITCIVYVFVTPMAFACPVNWMYSKHYIKSYCACRWVCDVNENDPPPKGFFVQMLSPQWVKLFGRIGRYNLVGVGMYLGVVFEISKAQARPRISHCLWIRRSSSQLLVPVPACFLPWHSWTNLLKL